MADDYEGDLAHADTAHQTAYVFAPKADLTVDVRSSKRRKVNKKAVGEERANEDEEKLYFPTLLNGAESEKCVKFRQELYEKTWGEADAKIQAILKEANEKTLSEVTEFLQDYGSKEPGSIPTGLIVTGPNIASQELLFSQLAERIKSESDGHSIVVNLRSGDATNLKAVLKKIIREATNEEHEDEDERLPASANEVQKLLNYDLHILHKYLGSDMDRRIVVAFQDSEAFDSSLLTELILLFKSWLDRIPFAILFGVATSVELFHERLSRSAIICLQGAQFNVENTSTTLEKIFEAVIFNEEATLRFGPNFLGSLLERQQDHVQNLQAFITALQYAYMTHFYANPLSIFLGLPPNGSAWCTASFSQPEHVEAIRMLPSFRADMEKRLKEGDTESLGNYIRDDTSVLIGYADVKIPFVQKFAQVKKFKSVNEALELVAPSVKESEIELYMMFVSQTINDSAIIPSLIDGCKKLTPSAAASFCQTILENQMRRANITRQPQKLTFFQISNRAYMNIEKDEEEYVTCLHALRLRFDKVVEMDIDAAKPIRSIYTQEAQTLRTTIGAGQRVQLEKANATLSKQDSRSNYWVVEFNDLIDELVKVVKKYFTFESPFLPGHEIRIYDSRSPFRETFTPRPRHAIERALSAPHDYLCCDCCRGSGGLSASQPPTAILYQLYLETGGLINVFDLWSAFKVIVSGDSDDEGEERKTLMLFYQSLADLKMMGAVKMSRRKTDHLGKLAWKGL